MIVKAFAMPESFIVKSNPRHSSAATEKSLRAAFASVAKPIDRDNDVLFVVLTSHGSTDGIGVVVPGILQIITAESLKDDDLSLSKMNYKDLIISACYSAIISVSTDADTLIITAAVRSSARLAAKIRKETGRAVIAAISKKVC